VELKGESYSAEELLPLVAQIRRAGPAEPRVRGGLAWPAGGAPQAAVQTEVEPAPVQSVAADVELAGWDADAEMDGLWVAVWPLAADQQAVPVRGVLTVTLFAARGGLGSATGRATVIGRWVRRVEPADFGPRGARYRLEFQAIDPARDGNWAPRGLVRVELGVPGQGTYRVEIDDVRIRSYSGFRDRLQLATGRSTP
jgi:hypothetical protein